MTTAGEDSFVRDHRVRWHEHNSARRARIIAAAVALIDTNNVDDEVPIQAIADRAGFSKSVLYRQFGGRDDLDRHVRTYIVEDSFEKLAPNLDVSAGSVREVITRTVRGLLDWRTDHPQRYAFLSTGPTDYDDPGVDALSSLMRRLVRLLTVVLTEIAEQLQMDHKPFNALAYAVMTMIDGCLTRWIRDAEAAQTRATVIRETSAFAWFLLDGAARSAGLHFDRSSTVATVVNKPTMQPRDCGVGHRPTGDALR